MLYGEIVWGGTKLAVTDQVVGSLFPGPDVDGNGAPGGGVPGAGTAVFPGPVYPGLVSITDGTNTWTETAPGSGILAGAPSGTGTVDYGAGVANLAGGDPGAQLEADFTYNTRRNQLPNPVSPMFANLVVGDAAGEFIIMIRDAPGNWRILPTLNQTAYEAVDLGLIMPSYIYVLATAKARLNGHMANQT